MIRNDPINNEIEIHETAVHYLDSSATVLSRAEQLIFRLKALLFGVGFLLFLIYELAHFTKFLIGSNAFVNEPTGILISTDMLIKVGPTIWILVVSSVAAK
jgi:hypothetical protein